VEPAAGGTDSSGQANLTAKPTRAGLRIVLHAPISGTVTSAQATAGEFVAKLWQAKYDGCLEHTLQEVVADVWQRTKSNQPLA